MSETLKGIARAAYREQYGAEFDSLRDGVREQFMKAALLWLADNVSDEMSIAAVVDWQNDKGGGALQEWLQSAISAALRAAAGDKQ